MEDLDVLIHELQSQRELARAYGFLNTEKELDRLIDQLLERWRLINGETEASVRRVLC